jgi:hypothetical protein
VKVLEGFVEVSDTGLFQLLLWKRSFVFMG